MFISPGCCVWFVHDICLVRRLIEISVRERYPVISESYGDTNTSSQLRSSDFDGCSSKKPFPRHQRVMSDVVDSSRIHYFWKATVGKL